MAFVSLLPTCSGTSNTRAARVSRRTVIRFAVLSVFGARFMHEALAEDTDIDVKELKDDVEALKYEEELLDVGPDPQELNILRVKKKEKEPEFRKEEKELLKAGDKRYDEMVAEELAEAKKLKANFPRRD